MRVSIATLVIVAFVLLGQAAAGLPAPLPGVLAAVACMSGAVAGACAFLWRERGEPPGQVFAAGPSRACFRALVVAWSACAMLRGLGAGDPARPPEPRRDDALVELRVVSAPRPGARCLSFVETTSAAPTRHALSTPTCPASRRVAVPSSALRPIAARVPGQVDPDGLARANGARDHLRSEHLWSRGRTLSGWHAFVLATRERAWRSAQGDPAMAFVVASVFGLDSALPRREREALRRSGLGHLIAVSGLNVALVALLVQAFVRRLFGSLHIHPRFATLASLVPVLAYVALTGAAAPAVRAAIMVLAVDAGVLVGRPIHRQTALFAAAAAMLLVRPDWAFDAGFQLSMAAMLAIVSAPTDGATASTNVRITATIAPLSVLHFGAAPVHGLVCNLVAIPVFTIFVLPLGMLGFAVEPLFGPVVLEPARAGARLLLDLAAVAARVPGIGAGPVVFAITAAAIPRWFHFGKPRPPWFRWLPPPIALPLAWLLVFSGAHTHAVETFVAIGGPRSHALVYPSDSPGVACLVAPGPAGDDWPSILRALDQEAAVVIADDDPRTRFVAADLAHAGMLYEGEARCVPPERDEVPELLRRCRALVGEGTVTVRAGDPPACFSGVGFVPLP